MIDKVKCNVMGAESWFSLRVLLFLYSTYLVQLVVVMCTYKEQNFCKVKLYFFAIVVCNTPG